MGVSGVVARIWLQRKGENGALKAVPYPSTSYCRGRSMRSVESRKVAALEALFSVVNICTSKTFVLMLVERLNYAHELAAVPVHTPGMFSRSSPTVVVRVV